MKSLTPQYIVYGEGPLEKLYDSLHSIVNIDNKVERINEQNLELNAEQRRKQMQRLGKNIIDMARQRDKLRHQAGDYLLSAYEQGTSAPDTDTIRYSNMDVFIGFMALMERENIDDPNALARLNEWQLKVLSLSRGTPLLTTSPNGHLTAWVVKNEPEVRLYATYEQIEFFNSIIGLGIKTSLDVMNSESDMTLIVDPSEVERMVIGSENIRQYAQRQSQVGQQIAATIHESLQGVYIPHYQDDYLTGRLD